jgi:hypothetical protein
VVGTQCAHCSEPMHIEIDNELTYSVREAGADPIIFIPQVDFQRLEAPSIIDSF